MSKSLVSMILLLCLLSIMQHVAGFVAYDCSGMQANYTSISLLDIQECESSGFIESQDEVVIQLLQPRRVHVVETWSCKVEVNYIVFNCGMHSHSSIVSGGLVSRLYKVDKRMCDEMHRTRELVLYGHRFSGLPMNSSVTTSVNFAGWVSADGSCQAQYFSDEGTNWGLVSATGSVKITLQERPGFIDSKGDKIRFDSGTICLLTDIECIDNDYGHTFWNTYTQEDCRRDAFHVLYRGSATRVRAFSPDGILGKVATYTVHTDEIVFTLTSTSSFKFCFFSLEKTDHPRLHIQVVEGDNYYFKQEEVPALDMDMFLYVNTKFLHLEKALSKEMTAMYREIVDKRCELERKALATKLSIAMISPMEFAYEFTGKPGSMAIVMGEAAYVFKCEPVEVSARSDTECTREMPVTYRNASFFMVPRSRVLQKTGTPLGCSSILKPKFRLEGEWYATSPSLHVVMPPKTLKPDNNHGWNYTSPGKMAVAGIYSLNELDKLREQIMAPLERRSKSERIAGLLNSEKISSGGLNLASIADGSYIDEKMQKIWDKMWNSFWYFGNVSAGFLGIMLLFRIAKFGLDTLIHAFSIYQVYGLTWYLLGAIWDAVTTYILNRDKSFRERKHEPANLCRKDIIEMESVAVRRNSVESKASRDETAHPSAVNAVGSSSHSTALYPDLSKSIKLHEDALLLRGKAIQ